MRALPFVIAIAGCASPSRLGTVRFENAPVAWRVNDRHDVPRPPAKRPYNRYLLHFDTYYIQATRGLALERNPRARGVNALDDVPDSTWFTNRIGKRALAPAEIRRGPEPGSPEQHRPWTVKRLKTGGTAPGLLLEDARGLTFQLKFDPKHAPEMETGADAITSRLLWAAGYNVSSDHVVYFRREDLVIPPDAKIGEHEVDALLAAAARVEDDGTIRGITSIYVEGKPIGGAPRLGVRGDDPNDRIPHELRRDQRGLAAFSAWLANNDLREDNTVDVWRADPADPRVHYVLHYLIDFGNSLGADAALAEDPYPGFEYAIDPKGLFASIGSFGIYRHPWEHRVTADGIRGVGHFSAEDYDPGAWKPNTPAQLPVVWADRFDQFWGAKILIRFTRDQIAAAVDAARFTDPRAKPYLVNTLIARQRKTARHWFRQVNPIDEPRWRDGKLCWVDLALRHRLETEPTRFTVTAFGRKGHRVKAPPVMVEPDASGRACVAPPLGKSKDRYTILLIDSSRGLPGTQIHVALDPATHQPRVIGLYRL